MKKIIYIVGLAFLVLGCKKDRPGYEVIVTVRDIESWTPEYPDSQVAPEADVSIYKQSSDPYMPPLFISTTNSSGEVTFELEPATSYYLVVDMGSRSNVISRETRDGFTVGYIIMNAFQSQAEVDSYAGFPGKALGAGDPKILDVNADGLITFDDKQRGYHFTAEDQLHVTVYIATITSLD